ncbi:NADPH-dependent ferric siderophore reductase, contains FAD-binding and SIP domains [Streptomyces sp. DvalAA-14]|uniref:siderophore-interacting protein n=1 Tax=unclassified Streptomyces TaxID=2593676 RepID=UPI00081B49DC|nr:MULTISPECIES: siderophore-interacting protein [unclassified Streptomyces]MYS22917.1 SIP domain-containing protein [Streptomyces sp. SID4948]SCE24492.1 NADPH-dependent ferric siderophore reductase, contains FAD-binding and SIP domains [Streptomyces sp. DvalAA-14]
MADRPQRRNRTPKHATVVRTERLTPHMIRVVLAVDPASALEIGAHTDHYVKLLFPPEGVTYPEPLDIEAIRRDLPSEQWPRTRTYTVRAWDEASRELTVDFVHHGDEGLAGPWAAAARPGESVHFMGPGGGYAPDPTADWHLLAGDESALPAIAAALEQLPPGAPAKVFVEVAGLDEEQKLPTAGEADIVWLHRGGGPIGAALVEAVTALDFPAGDVQVFVHGEAGFVKELRRHLRLDRAVPRERLSISGYWRRGADEDGWQASKREWNDEVEREQER